MSNIEKAEEVLNLLDHEYNYSEGERPDNETVVQALADAGLLAPESQVIRTVEELEALGEGALVQPPLSELSEWPHIISAAEFRRSILVWDVSWFPAVVVATGEQVRAARKALEDTARPDAHEVQGILGREWLEGEDPAGLVRKHREGRA